MPDPIPWPPYAYVPGQNARHPEDWFDGIKATLVPSVPVEKTEAWAVGLAYLEAGYFWECHEVLEAVWMALPNPSPERDVVQAVIQLANAKLKLRMGKPRAVLRLCDMVADLLRGKSDVILGLRMDDLHMTAQATRRMAQTVN